MLAEDWITTPADRQLENVCRFLAERAAAVDQAGAWPAEQVRQCGRAGVFRWFVEPELGGLGWDYPDQLRGLMQLASSCLATTFTLTQQTTSAKWLTTTENHGLRDRLLPALLEGEIFSCTGLSQLTTSRQHLGKPALLATPVEGGFRFDGQCPWVTGGPHADYIVIGAALEDGQQMLAAVPTASPGLVCDESAQLVALSATKTGAVTLNDVFVPDDHVVHPPQDAVMSRRSRGGTGGLETSALALGVAQAAVGYLHEQATRREELMPSSEALAEELAAASRDLLALANGQQPCSREEIRIRANSLVTRTAHAAITAAKGAGFLAGHPTNRWCREALFFLVWSCPQPVAQGMLCEFAGQTA